jgi:23S rRNA pseudouridine2605 synthase
MPRDDDKNNDSRGRRDRPSGGKGRSGAARGPEKKFAKRGFAVKGEGDKRSSAGKAYAGRREGAPPRRDNDDAPRRFDKDARRPRGDRTEPRKDFRSRDDRGGEKRPYTPRNDRAGFNRDDRAPRGNSAPRDRNSGPGDRGEARSASRFAEKKFGDKRPYAPRGERADRKFGDDNKFSRGGGRDRNSAPGDRNSAPGARGPRKEFDRGASRPWQQRDAGSSDHAGRNSRPQREGDRSFDRPRFDRPRYDKPREDRRQGERPFGERPKFERPREGREDRPKFEGPREGRNSWQEHPRSEPRSFNRDADRPPRDNEDDSKIFAKRPAFGGRGAYRERPSDERRPARPPREKKSGERIAKVVSRAGLASRRDAEEWIVQGRVTVNGRVINSPALDVTANDVITVDGKPLPPRERTRLFLFHKPRGLMTTHADPEGRPTVFDNLPEGLPRLISIGRLDFNTEGLLLLTNDGGLARALELPETGWLRRYRVRAHGEVTQAQLDELKKGVEVDGVKYGPIDATLERDSGANVWLVFAIREGKNREVRNVMAHLGLEVNRLIRVSYGPFQLGELAEGQVEEVKTRVLREQLGEKIATLAGADFTRPVHGESHAGSGEETDAPRGKKPVKRAVIADRKGRRVLVQRTGSEEARARNEAEANGYGPPRRPQRGYHGKRDLKPRDE